MVVEGDGRGQDWGREAQTEETKSVAERIVPRATWC